MSRRTNLSNSSRNQIPDDVSVYINKKTNSVEIFDYTLKKLYISSYSTLIFQRIEFETKEAVLRRILDFGNTVSDIKDLLLYVKGYYESVQKGKKNFEIS